MSDRATPSPESARVRIANLTGIRAFAVLWVIVLHVNTKAADGAGLGPLARHGYLGVDLFFVLSGFVLALVYVPRLPASFNLAWYRNYLSRRFAKIYPMHLLTFLLIAGMVLAGRKLHYNFTATADNTPWSALLQVLLLNAEGLTRELSWNTPSWSVGAEWFAYVVLFGPIVFLLRGVRVGVVAGLAALLWGAYLWLCRVLLEGNLDFTTAGALRITPEFFGGYLLYRLVKERSLPDGGTAWFAAGAAGVLAVCFTANHLNVLLLPSILLLLAGLYRGSAALDAVFGNRLAVRVGEWSYSIYLTHLMVSIVCFRLVAAAHLPYAGLSLVGILVFIATLAVVCGGLCFRFVEEPLRLWLLRVFDARTRTPEPARARSAQLPGKGVS